MYHTASNGVSQGELSRFLLQFLIEWEHPIQRKQLEAGQSPQTTAPISIAKTPGIMKRLQSVFDLRVNPKALLSPSALNTYLDCPLKFYYQYVANLRTPDEVTAEIDSAKFGTIFHDAAEHIYKDLHDRNKVINKEAIENLLKDKIRLNEYVDSGFKRLFFHIPENERPEYNGLQLINAAVIVRYLQQLLEKDLEYAPFTFVGSEQRISEEIDIQTPKGVLKSRIGGTIDRLDAKDGILRIVDYKTGGQADTPPNVASLFVPDKKRSNYVFQTFLYAAIVCRKLREKGKQQQVAPALLFIHRAATENYSPVIELKDGRKSKETVNDFEKYEPEFREELKKLLEEVFNPEHPFSQTITEEKCEYCDFKALCKR